MGEEKRKRLEQRTEWSGAIKEKVLYRVEQNKIREDTIATKMKCSNDRQTEKLECVKEMCRSSFERPFNLNGGIRL